MGQIRTAKDGHRYEYRRTYGGRFYTVQHGPARRSNPNPRPSGPINMTEVYALLFGAFAVTFITGLARILS